MNGRQQEVAAPWLSSLKTFRLVFGACKLNFFWSTDVCPMSVKNICLYKEKRLYRQWELSQHSRNKVYDKTVKAKAEAENPIWLIDKYIQWRKLKDIHVSHLLGIAADTGVSRLFFVNDQTVYGLDVHTLETDSVHNTQGVPYNDTMDEVLQIPPAAFSARHITAIALAVLFVLIAVVLGKKKVFPKGFRLRSSRKSMLNITPLPYIKRTETLAIYLFGEFQVFDKQGRNMASSFSPTLKHSAKIAQA
ncbi:MAG: hypothetical protein LBF62_03870 [Tannerellaceae bacterium]|jgi:hypothetical protein|nr:hypothetical protein [Tannerellaceae bacterium]